MTDEPIPSSAFSQIFQSTLRNSGYFCTASVRSIRRGIGQKVDQIYTEVERSQYLTQTDPRIFDQTYVANTSSFDDQGGAYSYGALDERDVSLNVLDVLCCALDLQEDFAHRQSLKHLADERDGGCKVGLNYIPWYLITSALIRSLRLVACFSQVRGVLIDVFRTIVYLQPSRRHYHEATRFRRVIRDSGLRHRRLTTIITNNHVFSKIRCELWVVYSRLT